MKTPLLLLVCFLSTSELSFAGKNFEEPSPVTRNMPYKKMIHLNPLALTVGGFELGFEKPTTNKESFYVNCGYYLSEEAGGLDAKADYSNMNGFRLELQYRFYRKTNNYIRNVYLAPFANFKTLSADYNKQVNSTSSPYTRTTVIEKRSATTVSFGYMLGLRKSIFENIYMDMGIGGGIFIPVSGENQRDFNIGLFNPYQKGVQFKASFGFLLAL